MALHGAVEALKCCELTTSVTPERSAGAVTPCMLTGELLISVAPDDQY